MQHDLATPLTDQEYRLLGPDDPAPVGIRPGGPLLLTVEHAGRAIPACLDGLGLSPKDVDRHIGWDIGALDLATALADALDATMIAQRYSRLVIDCNRPWGSEQLVPDRSDDTAVSGNAALGEANRRARWDEIHQPFHEAVASACADRATALLAVHSYDPRRAIDSTTRPWPIGLVYRTPNALADGLRTALELDERIQPLGVNQPYIIEDESDYTIPVHAEPLGLPHVLLEVRNDFLSDAEGVARIAGILADALRTVDLT